MSVRSIRKRIILDFHWIDEKMRFLATIFLASTAAASDIQAAIIAEWQRTRLEMGAENFGNDAEETTEIYMKPSIRDCGAASSPVITADMPLVSMSEFFKLVIGTSVETFVSETENATTNPLLLIIRKPGSFPVSAPEAASSLLGTRGKLASAFREQIRTWFDCRFQRKVFSQSQRDDVSRDRLISIVDKWTGSQPGLLRRAFILSGYGMIALDFVRMMGKYCDDFKAWEEVIPSYQVLRRASIRSQSMKLADVCKTLPSLGFYMNAMRKHGIDSTKTQLMKTLLGERPALDDPATQGTGSFTLHVPKDPAMRDAFESMLMAVILFRHSPTLKPESTLVSLLWAPIFRSALMIPSCTLLSDGTEFLIHSLMNDLKTNKLYADYVAWLSVETAHTPSKIHPVFFSEAAAESLSASIESKGHCHKDYRKLALSMLLSLQHFVGIFRHHPDLLRATRIYGAFTAGTQIQFCVAYPVVCEKTTSAVFETRPEWRFDLCDGKSSSESIGFRSAQSNHYSSDVVNILLPDNNGSTSSNDSWDFRQLVEDFNRINVNHLNYDKHPDCGSVSDLSVLSDQLLNILAFFQDVLKTAETMSLGLSRDNLGDPIILPPEFEKAISSGSTTKSSFSPQKTSTPQKKSASAPQSNNVSFMGVHVGTVIRTKKTNSLLVYGKFSKRYRVVVKHGQSDPECKMLREMMGQRHVVQLMSCKSLDPLPAYAMIQEDLVKFPIEMKNHGQPGLLSTRSALLLDAMSALNSLRRFQIIHRDFSVNNFMYSENDRCWKLIDFQLAVYANESGIYISGRDQVCGTKDHLAPELLNPEQYQIIETNLDDQKSTHLDGVMLMKRVDSGIESSPPVETEFMHEQQSHKIVYSYASDMFAAARAILHFRFHFFMEWNDNFEEDPIACRLFNQQHEILFDHALNEDPSKRSHPMKLYEKFLNVHSEIYRHYHDYVQDYQPSIYDEMVHLTSNFMSS